MNPQMETKSLIQSLNAKAAAERRAAFARYVELLESNVGGEAETEEMAGLMQTLGKRLEDLPEDRATLSRARTLCAQYDNGCGIRDAREQAGKDITAHNEKMEREMAKLRTEQLRLRNVQSELEGRHMDGQRAVHELGELKRKHPELLADFECGRVEDMDNAPKSRAAARK